MARPTQSARSPEHVLENARQGDHTAFSEMMEPHRRELVAYCYRLTGSLSEAEDLTQEVFVKAFRALGSFEGRASTRAWLYRIAHNLCVNHVLRDKRPYEPLDVAVHDSEHAKRDDRAGEVREDVRLGFVALIQSIPPRQRAALVLRDVLGWSAEETAKILDTTVPSVKNSLARARKTLSAQQHGNEPSEVQDIAANDPAARELIARWVDAFEKGNTIQIVHLLTDGDQVWPDHVLKGRRSTSRTAREKRPIPAGNNSKMGNS